VDFQQDDSQGNPVLAYLQRHGTAQGLTTPLANGYSLNTPDFSTTFNTPLTNEPYSKISGDFNPIVSYVFALYNPNPKFMSITSLKWYQKDSYGVVNGISVSESLWRESPDLYIGLAIDIVYQM
jgi:hypothetical protein